MWTLGGWPPARTGRIPPFSRGTKSISAPPRSRPSSRPSKNARAASQTALTATDREREEAQAVSAEAHPLAVDICDTVEFHFRRDPSPSSWRSKCPRWGVVYLYGDQETPDPGDTPAPPAP